MTGFSLPQRLFKAILSRHSFDKMEIESRSWMVRCCNCDHERSIWEMGGIRWKASGNPRVYRPCPNCSQRNWHRISQKH